MMTWTAVEPLSRSDAESPFVGELKSLAVRALQRMYRPRERLFAFRARRTKDSYTLEGTSRRYTAIALIGLAHCDDGTAESVFGGESAKDVCGRLLADLPRWTNLGDVALTIWAANEWGMDGSERSIRHLVALAPDSGRHPTVEIAWALRALSPLHGKLAAADWAERIADRLLASFNGGTGLFAHWPSDLRVPWHRSHICCFADFVYPIQALAAYSKAADHAVALAAARQSARVMCDLQGYAGQWWWHFDHRTGAVVERYPVYAVHQNSMAPMALLDLGEVCSDDYRPAIDRGLSWLARSPEIDASLLDTKRGFIWRKVARHEPGKLARSLQAVVSRIHPSFRFPCVDALMPATWVDFESRPYHMGWILYAWRPRFLAGKFIETSKSVDECSSAFCAPRA